MDNDLDRSAERLARSEETRARLTGFGTGKQGQAIERQFHDQLAKIIGANRGVHRRERPVWGDYQEFRARGRFSSLADEPFAEDDGELGLGLEPLARRPFPFVSRVVQNQV